MISNNNKIRYIKVPQVHNSGINIGTVLSSAHKNKNYYKVTYFMNIFYILVRYSIGILISVLQLK